MLNSDEARAIYQLLNRVTVNGQEADTLVALKQKLADIANGVDYINGQPVFRPTEDLNKAEEKEEEKEVESKK